MCVNARLLVSWPRMRICNSLLVWMDYYCEVQNNLELGSMTVTYCVCVRAHAFVVFLLPWLWKDSKKDVNVIVLKDKTLMFHGFISATGKEKTG